MGEGQVWGGGRGGGGGTGGRVPAPCELTNRKHCLPHPPECRRLKCTLIVEYQLFKSSVTSFVLLISVYNLIALQTILGS